MEKGKKKAGRSYWITVCGEQVFVERKKIKHLYLKLEKQDGSLCISAPEAMLEEKLLQFVQEKKAWIAKARERLKERCREEAGLTPQELERQKEVYRKQLLKVLPGVIEKCERTTGLHAEQWQLRYMKTRWGSCHIGKKKICLNLQLAAYPEECLEYVVTHELVHLLERGHNQVFWGYMDKFFPNWRQVRKILR